jgi:hypothetical protein
MAPCVFFALDEFIQQVRFPAASSIVKAQWERWLHEMFTLASHRCSRSLRRFPKSLSLTPQGRA